MVYSKSFLLSLKFLKKKRLSFTPVREESIRLIAFHQAQTDLRALTALAEKTSYEHVMELIEGDLGEPITFERFPQGEYYYINLRNKVNLELNKY